MAHPKDYSKTTTTTLYPEQEFLAAILMQARRDMAPTMPDAVRASATAFWQNKDGQLELDLR
jgi:hypothetical protein